MHKIIVIDTLFSFFPSCTAPLPWCIHSRAVSVHRACASWAYVYIDDIKSRQAWTHPRQQMVKKSFTFHEFSQRNPSLQAGHAELPLCPEPFPHCHLTDLRAALAFTVTPMSPQSRPWHSLLTNILLKPVLPRILLDPDCSRSLLSRKKQLLLQGPLPSS